MGIDTDNLPPLWTALKVNCCNSRVFSGYLCGASDSSEADLVLCSMPEAKIIFVSGWAIEKIEVISNYPPLTDEVKAKLDSIYTSVVEDMDSKEIRAGNVELRKQSVLQHFGPLVAKAEDDGKIVLYDGVVTLLPPYLPSSCRSTNPVVLERVRDALMQIDEQPR